jgi:membrane protease YdiL (CAAX protease family)
MNFTEPAALAYLVIYLAALVVAIWKRKTFPLQESIMVVVIVGFGFTALVHWLFPVSTGAPSPAPVSTSELTFTVLYLAGIAALLVFPRPMPEEWKGDFVKKRLVDTVFKLSFFVVVPLAALRLIWQTPWQSLGFRAGNIEAIWLPTLLLCLVFGAFNLLAGSSAAPVRKGQYNAGQIGLGFALALAWNLLEVGLVEEFFFRAFLQGRLTSFLGSPLSGVLIASLLFGLAHAPGIYLRKGDQHGPLGEKPSLLNAILYTILVLSPTGWFMGLLYWRTQSLLAPILVHAVVDSVAHLPLFIEGVMIHRS